MNVTILGNGGALNEGLDYNAFLIGASCLCEVPPDIMRTLHRAKADLSLIDTIFISHFHADHFFGLPFLFLSLFAMGSRSPRMVRIIGPSGIQDHCFSLTEAAFTSVHPCLLWMTEHLRFEEACDGYRTQLAGFEAEFFGMDHFSETYGFVLHGSGVPFGYTADTLWCESLERMISRCPAKLLIDLNGEPSDPRAIHLSEKELVEKGFPLADGRTCFFGTHLRTDKKSMQPLLQYVRSGDVIAFP